MVGVSGRSGGNRLHDGVDMTKPDGPPNKPLLSENVSAKWDELLAQLPSGSLRRIDCHELKLLAELLVMADSLVEVCRLNPSDYKAARVYLNVVAQIHRLSSAFGLNPFDRKRLQLAPEHEECELTTMLKRRMTPKEI